MTSKENRGYLLAEAGQWNAVASLVLDHPEEATIRDERGMLPLHWACTDINTPFKVLEILINTYADGANIPNQQGLLPLDLAKRFGLTMSHQKLLKVATKFEKIQKVYEQPNQLDDIAGFDSGSVDELCSEMKERCTNQTEELRESDFPSTCNECHHEVSNRLFALVGELQNVKQNLCEHKEIYDTMVQPKLQEQRKRLSMVHQMSNHESLVQQNDVHWSHGHLGVSLAKIPSKPGAMISRFTNKGDVRGLEHLRVGDFLVSVNGIYVLNMEFKSVVRVLKNAEKPALLKFLPCLRHQNPIDSGAHFTSTTLADGSLRSSPSKVMMDMEKDDVVSNELRPTQLHTSSSLRQCESQLDQIEAWCERQDEMHSQLVLLMTETLGVCETLGMNIFREQPWQQPCHQDDDDDDDNDDDDDDDDDDDVDSLSSNNQDEATTATFNSLA